MQFFDGGFDFGGVTGSRQESLLPVLQNTQSSGSSNVWGELIRGGFGVLNTWLQSKLPPAGAVSQNPIYIPTSSGLNTPQIINAQLPAVIAGGEAAGSAAGVIRAAGGTIIGTTIRIARAAYNALPEWVKQAAVAAGLTWLFTEATSGGSGTGRRRRGKGITGAELRGFNKMTKLLKKVGMRPKALGGGRGSCRKKC